MSCNSFILVMALGIYVLCMCIWRKEVELLGLLLEQGE